MDNIHALFYHATECLGSGNLKSSYELYLKALDATLYELHQIKFIDQHALFSDNKDGLFVMAKTCLENTQTILNNTKRRSTTPPPIPPKPLSISKRKPFSATTKTGTASTATTKTTTTTLMTRTASIKSNNSNAMTTIATMAHQQQQQTSQIRSATVWKKMAQKPAAVIVPNKKKATTSTNTTAITNKPAMITTSPTSTLSDNHYYDENKRDEELKIRPQLLRSSSIGTTTIPTPSSPLVNPINVVKTFLSSSLQDKPSPSSSVTREDEVIVMASGAVDPFRLTPAQTLDNTNNNHNNIPSIPQAPLHMIYKSLQQKLENLERHHLHSTEVKQALNRVQQIIHMTGNSSTAHLPTTLTTTTTITTTTLLAFPPVLIAYQLTLIDSAIFRNIQPSALLNHHAPKSPHPAIVASTDFFNYLTRIIEHMILTPSEASGRAEQINFWIKVAIKCHDLKNFQTLKAIISALGTPPIQRLKRSWAYVPKKSMARLDVVNEIMTEHNNYERYRDRITRIVQQTSREPVIPFLGVFMHDVTYITSIPVASSSSSSAPATSLSSSLPTTSTNTCNNNKQVTKLDDQLTLFTNLHKHPPYSSALPPFCVKDFNKKQQQRKPFANESLELQQCLVTHYLLTRSWVSEKTVDELSLLRETPKVMRSCSAIDHSMTYDGGSWSSSGSFLSYIGTHSMVSSSSSSRPISLESDDDDNDSDVESNKQNNNININSKFWVFGRKSVDHQHHQQHKKPSLQIDHHHHAIPMLPAVAPKHLRRERLSRHFSFEDLDVRKKQHQQPVSSQSQQQQQGLSIFRKDFTFWRKEQDVPSTEPSSPQHPLDFDPMYKRNSVTLLERPIAS